MLEHRKTFSDYTVEGLILLRGPLSEWRCIPRSRCHASPAHCERISRSMPAPTSAAPCESQATGMVITCDWTRSLPATRILGLTAHALGRLAPHLESERNTLQQKLPHRKIPAAQTAQCFSAPTHMNVMAHATQRECNSVPQSNPKCERPSSAPLWKRALGPRGQSKERGSPHNKKRNTCQF